MKFKLHGYRFPVRSRVPQAAMLLGAGSVAYVGDGDGNVTSLATARQPETISLKFSKSVTSVVCKGKAGS